MGTMSNVDHSTERKGANFGGGEAPDMGPLVNAILDSNRLLDFIAKKDVVNIETTPKVEVHPPAVNVQVPESRVAVPITVPVPTVSVTNSLENKGLKALTWLISVDIFLRVAEFLWHTVFTKSN